MSTDLKYLAFTAILTASLWIPYIVCQVMTNGGLRRKITSISHQGRYRCGACVRTALTRMRWRVLRHSRRWFSQFTLPAKPTR